jgi:hypothetical protein
MSSKNISRGADDTPPAGPWITMDIRSLSNMTGMERGDDPKCVITVCMKDFGVRLIHLYRAFDEG